MSNDKTEGKMLNRELLQQNINDQKLLKKGFYYQKTGQFAQALECFSQIYFEGSKYQAMAYCYSEMGQCDDAIETFKKIPQWDQKRHILRGIARCYKKNAQYDLAIEMYKKLDSRDEYMNILLEVANCYTRMGQYEKAIDKYRKVYQLNPNKIESLLKIASCYTMMGNEVEANKIYSDIIKKHPQSQYFHHLYSDSLFRLSYKKYSCDISSPSFSREECSVKTSPHLRFSLLSRELRKNPRLADYVKKEKETDQDRLSLEALNLMCRR